MAVFWSHKFLMSVQAIAVAGLLARMLANGLDRIYRVFFLYLWVFAAQLVIPLLVSNRRTLYGYLYFSTECAILCFYALIVLEMYTLVLRDLHGIASLARRYTKVALAAAIGGATVLLLYAKNPEGPIRTFLLFDRTIVCSLVFFVFLITAFLVYYPIPLHRNVIWYSIGYACYFAGKAMGLFLLDWGPEWNRWAEPVVLANSAVWLTFLAVALTRAGERKTAIFGHKWNTGDEQKLVRQLESINATLLRARKN